MKTTITTSNWKMTGLRGLLALSVGSALLVWPGVGLGALALAFGVALGIGGALTLGLIWRRAPSTETRVLLGLEGLVMLTASGACLAYPEGGLMALVGLTAFWLFLEGGLALRLAWRGERRVLLATLGTMSVLCGVALLASPLFGALTVLVLAAAHFLVTGALLVALAWELRGLHEEGVERMQMAVDPDGPRGLPLPGGPLLSRPPWRAPPPPWTGRSGGCRVYSKSSRSIPMRFSRLCRVVGRMSRIWAAPSSP